jgi:hypothetical protein
VPQINITVFLNTNITSKVLGTQLVAFGNGQTSALDEALLIIDEPNSPNSPGVQCGSLGQFNGNNDGLNNCIGSIGGASTFDTAEYSVNGYPYPILNCGAVVSTTPAAPDGGPSGPGVCDIIAVGNTTTGHPAPEHTYDGTVAGGAYNQSGAWTITSSFPDACAINTIPGSTITTDAATVTQGSLFAVFTTGTPSTSWVGGSIAGGGIPGGTTIIAVSGQTVQMSNAASASGTAEAVTIVTLATSVAGLGSIGTVNAPGYGCGRPNVFQGRLGALQNPNQYNAVTFWGVPLDPPGTAIGRTIRITNIRANANQLGVSSTFTTQQILMNIAINGPTTVTIANPQQIVAYVNKGLNPAPTFAPATNLNYGGVSPSGQLSNTLPGGVLRTGVAPNVPVVGEFVQCISENPSLFAGTPAPSFVTPGYLGNQPTTDAISDFPDGFDCSGGGDCTANTAGVSDVTPWVRFSEGFASSWKDKNISFTVGNPTGTGGNATPTFSGPATVNGFTCENAYCYNGGRNYPNDIPQNVPGAVYNTETGFSYPTAVTGLYGAPPVPNPPLGFQFNSAILGGTVPNQGNPFTDDWGGTANATGIGGAGIANQGTRLYLSFTNIPAGTSLWAPPVIYLFRQGVVHNGDPATLGPNPITGAPQAQTSGVMVMTNTDASGNGAFSRTTSPVSPTTNAFQLQKVGASGLITYEILYTDPYSTEYADVPVVLAYASNPGQNLPAPAPPNPNTQVTGGFAPFYTSAASTQPSPNATFQSPTLPVPRFVPGQAFDFINIQKCACNLLFPFVANVLGYDTGIAIANSSLDPGSTFGFLGVPQPGTVQFWYYGTMANGAAVPGPQTSSVVQPGTVLTYVLSSGSSTYGLDGRGAGLEGYMITQAQFQYCHAYAFVSAQGAGPTSPGVSEGYLGIVLDKGGLPRTISIGENDAH